jgi:hypothetical protein
MNNQTKCHLLDKRGFYENKKPLHKKRFTHSTRSSPYLSDHFDLQELAPFQAHHLKVAGLHWAFPSATLDKRLSHYSFKG